MLVIFDDRNKSYINYKDVHRGLILIYEEDRHCGRVYKLSNFGEEDRKYRWVRLSNSSDTWGREYDTVKDAIHAADKYSLSGTIHAFDSLRELGEYLSNLIKG